MSQRIVKEAVATDKMLMKLIQAVKDAGIYPECVDNLVSTSTDKPLSANQGRILNESISSLSTLETITFTPVSGVLSTYSATRCIKCGKICTLAITGTITYTSDWTKIGEISTSVAPSSDVFFVCHVDGVADAYLYVANDGNIYFICGSALSSKIIRGSVTWIIGM